MKLLKRIKMILGPKKQALNARKREEKLKLAFRLIKRDITSLSSAFLDNKASINDLRATITKLSASYNQLLAYVLTENKELKQRLSELESLFYTEQQEIVRIKR